MADKLQLVLEEMTETRDKLENVNDCLMLVEEQLEAASTKDIYNRVSKQKELLIRQKENLTEDLLRQVEDLLWKKENLLTEQPIRSPYGHAAPSVERFWARLAISTEGDEVLWLAPGH
ncbi:hypothetical protein VOLCADRAFT_93858 [Volvox carteri f. nagariensis]|uniref:Uncharacterized protein n=1 Tax=Volvox carteri f. nagariensis TaxID=3068 RepID=D8U390_VOLCA|nr:uncharacterized protein VOLCADRAFT_93858 [Volvox carteri f. nagariensis]EFJ45711.1 hypothetical protein VOLCADRAFT_93858 [Volvox carteri f. nagariensis]|eukprot:XP_002953112.1 hypothetical protein VOLCADRAFT_93858 [Volvox carteri f. nagariensis]